MHKSIEIEETADGSHTLYVPQLDEHYHSTNGAIQESRHVYINEGFKKISKSEISVLEIGFGTGLNAYLTLLETTNNISVYYTAFELYPINDKLIKKINYPELLKTDSSLFEKLHKANWNTKIQITSSFSLNKINQDFTSLTLLADSDLFDLIYYDAFAPDKQAEMWTQAIFDHLYKHTSPNGILVTYCAKGSVRRMLQEVGYIAERLPGPPGKREILRASKKA